MDKKVTCYDIDGTLAKDFLFVPLITSEHEQGLIDDVTYTSLISLLGQYKQGTIDYETAVDHLIDTHAQGLQGQNEKVLKQHADTFIHERERNLFRSFGKQVVELLRKKNAQLAVTAEPQYLAQSVVDFYGLDGSISTQYEIKNNIFTGNVTRSLAHRSAKLIELSNMDVEYAFGDSEGDIEMLRKAAHAYCINPTDGLREVAEASGWYIYENDEKLISAINQSLET